MKGLISKAMGGKNMFGRELVVAVGLIAALLAGCEKKEQAPAAPAAQHETAKEAPAAASAPAAAAEVFSITIPAPIAGKKFATGGKANVELLNKKKVDKSADVKAEDGLELEGWAISDTTKNVPDTIAIELVPSATNGAKYYAMANRNTRKRDDVSKFFKEAAYQNAGFKINADIKPVPAGEYTVIVIQLVDGKPFRAYPNFKINKVN